MCDNDGVFLSLYCVAFQKCTTAETTTFLYRASFGSIDFQVEEADWVYPEEGDHHGLSCAPPILEHVLSITEC